MFSFNTAAALNQEIINGPASEKVILIGTAVDGPDNVPYRVTSVTEFERIFGPAVYTQGYKDPVTSTENGEYNGATLPLSVSQALAATATNIYVVRVPGTYAAAATAFSSKLNIQARHSGRIYNEVSLSIASTGGVLTLIHIQPAIKGGTYTTTYASSYTVSDVIQRINNDYRNRTVRIMRNTFPAYLTQACTVLGSGTVTLSGGTNGTAAKSEDYATSLNSYATRLAEADTGTFAMLLNDRHDFDVAILTGVHIDDQVTDGGTENTDTIATDFVIFLDHVSQFVSPCHGIMATRPHDYETMSELVSYINNNLLATEHGFYSENLRWNKAGPFLNSPWLRNDDWAGTVDMGARLSVVAGPAQGYVHPQVGRYTSQPHVSYGAFLSTFPPYRSPLMRPLPGIAVKGTPYPMAYAELLAKGVGYQEGVAGSGKGAYVCLVRDPQNSSGPLVILSDVNAASRQSRFAQNQLVRLCNTIHRTLQAELYPFLGWSMDHAALAAIETKVENVLEGFAQSRGIYGGRGEGYDFQVRMDGQDYKLGIVRLKLEITPATTAQRFVITMMVKE